MAITSAGYTGTVDQVDFAEMLQGVADHGVVGEWNDSSLSASKVSGQRTMLVQPGSVWVPGVLTKLTVAQNAVAAGALSGTTRIDLLVAKFNWSTGATTFEMKAGTAGTGQPPAVTQTPGVLWEVPLRQGTLTTASPSEYVSSSVTERRYWIQQGKYVLANATQLPPAKIGAVAYRPDSKQVLTFNGAGWDTYKAYSDTGWNQIVAPIGGFTGATWGRIVNGMASVAFPWVKGSTSITSATNIDITLPTAYIPSFDQPFSALYAESPKAPVLVTLTNGSPVLRINGLVLTGGARLQGTITYPVG
jgi:hypothetical protein